MTQDELNAMKEAYSKHLDEIFAPAYDELARLRQALTEADNG